MPKSVKILQVFFFVFLLLTYFCNAMNRNYNDDSTSEMPGYITVTKIRSSNVAQKEENKKSAISLFIDKIKDSLRKKFSRKNGQSDEGIALQKKTSSTELMDVKTTKEVSVTKNLAGDFNKDGFIDDSDLSFVISQWGGNISPLIDTDGDGIMGLAELTEVLVNWGVSYNTVEIEREDVIEKRKILITTREHTNRDIDIGTYGYNETSITEFGDQTKDIIKEEFSYYQEGFNTQSLNKESSHSVKPSKVTSGKGFSKYTENERPLAIFTQAVKSPNKAESEILELTSNLINIVENEMNVKNASISKKNLTKVAMKIAGIMITDEMMALMKKDDIESMYEIFLNLNRKESRISKAYDRSLSFYYASIRKLLLNNDMKTSALRKLFGQIGIIDEDELTRDKIDEILKRLKAMKSEEKDENIVRILDYEKESHRKFIQSAEEIFSRRIRSLIEEFSHELDAAMDKMMAAEKR